MFWTKKLYFPHYKLNIVKETLFSSSQVKCYLLLSLKRAQLGYPLLWKDHFGHLNWYNRNISIKKIK